MSLQQVTLRENLGRGPNNGAKPEGVGPDAPGDDAVLQSGQQQCTKVHAFDEMCKNCSCGAAQARWSQRSRCRTIVENTMSRNPKGTSKRIQRHLTLRNNGNHFNIRAKAMPVTTRTNLATTS